MSMGLCNLPGNPQFVLDSMTYEALITDLWTKNINYRANLKHFEGCLIRE